MERLEVQLKDYVRGGMDLFWQRQGMFAGATILAAAYYSYRTALICYIFCLCVELFDLLLSKAVLRWDGKSPRKGKRYLILLTVDAALSACFISTYAILIARDEAAGTHFAPLLFLMSSALFAVMNNHQLISALMTKLIIYSITFIYIPVRDLWIIKPELTSNLWLQFITVIFVLYFLADSARVVFHLYRSNLDRFEDLVKERDRAMLANESKSIFLSTISHELRTPLTSIKGALNMMNSGALGEAPKEWQQLLHIASDNSDRLAALINDLLDLQRIETGKMSFTLAPTDISMIVRDAVHSIEPFAQQMDVSISTTGLDAPMIVNADGKRLTQVVLNVLSNAIKFSNNSKAVDVLLEQVDGQARISVQDYGIGIEEDSEERVFALFSQIDTADNRIIGGSGLGMSISKLIMRHHNGSIYYESEIGKGTTFFIDIALLPYSEQAEYLSSHNCTASQP